VRLVRVLVATTNRNKLREIRTILTGESIELVGLDAFPELQEPEEHGTTFAENARAKACYYSIGSGMPAVAEDSGLEVDGLDGDPGVHSARYGGPAAAAYPDKFALIFTGLRARGREGSTARFVCALAVAGGDRILFEARGTIEGELTPSPRGSAGFGYDPIFFYPPLGRTLAELTEAEKSVVSHRGQAFRALRAWLSEHGARALDVGRT
jgi:XTP/dITP diphosphohydrolase